MPIINEQKIKDDLKSGKLSPVYFLYGEEIFLVKTYADKIKNKALGGDESGINLVETGGNPDFSKLSDHIEAVPFFSDYKVIMINDFNPEVLANQTEDEMEIFQNVLSNMPETAVLIFYNTGISFSARSAKVKKVWEIIKKYAAVCEFKPLSLKEVTNIIYKKVEKEKRTISPANAEYLAEITLCDLNLASSETRKLCNYVDEGKEITREIIDVMVEKRLETKVFSLSDAMLRHNKKEAFRILNELFEQRAEPVVILATLSSAYSEFYIDKAAVNSSIPFNQVASDCGYTGFKANYASKKYNQAKTMDSNSLRQAMSVIYDTDIKLKSVKIDGRLLLEETVLKLMELM